MAIRRTSPHAVPNAPPPQNAAERKHEGHLHNGTGKKPQTPFSQVLSGEQERHAHRNGSGEAGAPKLELSVPIDPRNLRVIMREAQAELQPAGVQGQEGASSQASHSRRRLTLHDPEYGLGGKKSEHVQRLLEVHRARLDEDQKIIAQFSYEIGMQLEVLKELKGQVLKAKSLFNNGDVAAAVQCIAGMVPTSTRLSARVLNVRKGKMELLEPPAGSEERMHESIAALTARAAERKRAADLYSVRISHWLAQPAQGITGEIDLLNIVQKTPSNVSTCIYSIERSIKTFYERAAKIRNITEIREEPYSKTVNMLRID